MRCQTEVDRVPRFPTMGGGGFKTRCAAESRFTAPSAICQAYFLPYIPTDFQRVLCFRPCFLGGRCILNAHFLIHAGFFMDVRGDVGKFRCCH
jgi:hypothetical protein